MFTDSGDRDHLEGRKDLLELLDRSRASRNASVADKSGGLVGPFGGEIVDGVLERRVVAEVVLRSQPPGTGSMP
jgi:hypothetical protein